MSVEGAAIFNPPAPATFTVSPQANPGTVINNLINSITAPTTEVPPLSTIKGGGTILLTAGQYNLDVKIQKPWYVNLIGEGWGTQLIAPTTDFCILRTKNSSFSTETPVSDLIANMQLLDNVGNTGLGGLAMQDVGGLTVSKVLANNFIAADGFQMDTVTNAGGQTYNSFVSFIECGTFGCLNGWHLKYTGGTQAYENITWYKPTVRSAGANAGAKGLLVDSGGASTGNLSWYDGYIGLSNADATQVGMELDTATQWNVLSGDIENQWTGGAITNGINSSGALTHQVKLWGMDIKVGAGGITNPINSNAGFGTWYLAGAIIGGGSDVVRAFITGAKSRSIRVVNNTDLIAYSDNETTTKWKISGGKFTNYLGINTLGNAFPTIYADGAQTLYTNAAPTTMTYTPPATAGIYRVHGYLNVLTGGTLTFRVKITYKDPGGNAVTDIPVFTQQNSATLLVGGPTANTTGRFYFTHDVAVDNSATAIALADNAGTYTAGTYYWTPVLEQLA